MIEFIFLLIAITAYSISQLANHGRLRWESKDAYGFWGEDMDKRKYTSKIPFAKTFLVFLTDGYHFCQFIFFLSLSLSFTLTLGFTWVKFGLAWGGVHAIHFITYKLLSR